MPEQSKASLIAERQANLPLPEEPPVSSDWNSSDARTVNTKPGEHLPEPSTNAKAQGTTAGLEGSATKGSGVREAGGVDMSEVGRK